MEFGVMKLCWTYKIRISIEYIQAVLYDWLYVKHSQIIGVNIYGTDPYIQKQP